MDNDFVYYCPVCGNVLFESHFRVFPKSKQRCYECKSSPMVSTDKDSGEFYPEDYDFIAALKSDESYDWQEEVRRQFVYGNPQFDQKKCISREKGDAAFDANRQKEIYKREHGPKCPTCGSSHVEKMGAVERGVSIAMLGMFSKKINKTFKCDDCGYTW